MLFNSFEFIFCFLPVALIVFFAIGRSRNRRSNQLAIAWLVAASLFFYGWWNPANLGLIILSIVFNYLIGKVLSGNLTTTINRKFLLFFGISVNLALIAYFKYRNFFWENTNHLFGSTVEITPIVLPLAISFFTFQQIAYLVDAYRGETKEYDFLNYCLFVSFFPQLIAGPIVHHKDVLPQFRDSSIYRANANNLSIGLTVFFMGLFKKIVFADGIATYVAPIFGAAAQGTSLTFFEAWVGALAYTLQLYFDFSGYSDMAIGAAYLFGIRLPLNFDSPYKATSIIDFWRRWHITLSHFLRDYLYIPLGGNRQGKLRRYGNLMVTMLLGGLWHGAGWTFVFWGGLHGLYLVINHQWRAFRRGLGHDLNKSNGLRDGMARSLTFLAVVVSWVFFRANTMGAATAILSSMAGLNGISLPRSLFSRLGFLENWGLQFNGLKSATALPVTQSVLAIALLLLIVWLTPNTQQWMGRYNPTLTKPIAPSVWSDRLWQKWQWQPTQTWAAIGATLMVVSLLSLTRVSEFLYFQF